jgi:hypothetical protein
MGAAMGRRKQSGDRSVADPGGGGRRGAMGAAMGRRKQSGDRAGEGNPATGVSPIRGAEADGMRTEVLLIARKLDLRGGGVLG